VRTFTEKHLKELAAIEIDGKIIKIVQILDVMGNEFAVSFTRTSLAQRWHADVPGKIFCKA